MNEVATNENPATANTANIAYILYLTSIFFGITGIIGVVIAYVNISDAPDWLKTHYRFQIRTFWIGALYSVIGVLLYVFVIGYFILLFTLIWLIVRCIKGMKVLAQRQPYPNPTGWMF